MKEIKESKSLEEFSEAFYELFEGILGNEDLRERYKSDMKFKTFVDDALNLYDGCKNDVLETYGMEGLKSFRETVSPKVSVVKRVIEY